MVPPLVGVAVNVTNAPAHTDVELAATDTDGVTELVVIVTVLLVAVVGEAHDALEVMITFTTSPFLSVVDEKVLVFVPAFIPLTCHW